MKTKERILLITEEDNFSNIDILLRYSWDNFHEADFNRLKNYWEKVIVENIRRQEIGGEND